MEQKTWLTKKEASEHLGIGMTTFYERVRDGSLPKPSLVLGERAPRWHRPTIDKLMRADCLDSQPTIEA